MHTVTTKVTIYLILCQVFHFATREHSFTFDFPWWGTERACKSGQNSKEKGDLNYSITVNRSRAYNVPFTVFTRTVANESLLKRPNFHFESKQSRANKFCKNGNSGLLCNAL